jgi:phosphopantothenoylcysteine synthetase/decarboxylase
MTDSARRPVLYIIACGGRPAGDLPQFTEYARRQGWEVCVIATPSAVKFLDPARLAALTGHPVRSDYKQPEEPDVLPPPDAYVVAPATFNTINKLAAGISDTLALGLLNEAVGAGLPIIAVPFPNQMLARHPVFIASVATLRSWGVRLLFDPARHTLPVPNQGESGNALFPWAALRDELAALRADAPYTER